MANTETISVAGSDFKKTDYFIFKDGKLYRNVAAGQIKEDIRPYRVAGNYNLYVISQRDVQLPHSTYLIADKRSGEVFEFERVLYGTEREYVKALVEKLKQRK